MKIKVSILNRLKNFPIIFYILISLLSIYKLVYPEETKTYKNLLYSDGNIKIITISEFETCGIACKFYIYYKNKIIYSDEIGLIEDEFLKKIDINKDGKVDILWMELWPCSAGAMCQPYNLILFKNNKRPKLIGFTGNAKFKNNKFYVFVSFGYCDEILLTKNKNILEYNISSSGGLAGCVRFQNIIYKINLKEQKLVLDKKSLKDNINKTIGHLKNQKYVYVFYNKRFLEDYFKNKNLILKRSEYEESNLDNPKNLKVALLGTSYFSDTDIIRVYQLALIIDKSLANKILSKYFLFEIKLSATYFSVFALK